MNAKEKIAKVKSKIKKVALKTATVAALVTGASGCGLVETYERNADTNENGEKIERVEGRKTSVVFRTKQAPSRSDEQILLENGDVLTTEMDVIHDGTFLEPGDTVTYEGNDVKAVRYKDGSGKNVNFGVIGKLERDITD